MQHTHFRKMKHGGRWGRKQEEKMHEYTCASRQAKMKDTCIYNLHPLLLPMRSYLIARRLFHWADGSPPMSLNKPRAPRSSLPPELGILRGSAAESNVLFRPSVVGRGHVGQDRIITNQEVVSNSVWKCGVVIKPGDPRQARAKPVDPRQAGIRPV